MRRRERAALLLIAFFVGCAAPESRATEMPTVQCMTPDGRCAARIRRTETPSLERAHADARDAETRRQLCADERAEMVESLGLLAEGCRADHECMTIEVLECGAAVADDAETDRLEARWRSYERVCGPSEAVQCAGLTTSCEAGRCARGIGLVRP